MQTTTPTDEKRTALEHLAYGASTARRTAWECWEFTIPRPGTVTVTNASYGYLKHDHTYEVTVENCDGVATPTECTCPADQYNDEYACKHRVALASIGGPTVLQAALERTGATPASPDTNSGTAADSLATDGGHHTTSDPDGCPFDRAGCGGPESEIVGCFDCYQPRGGN